MLIPPQYGSLLQYPYYSYLGLAISLCAVAVALARSQRHVRLSLPPSPPSDFVIGHLRTMPMENQWLTFTEWGKKLGDVIYISVFGRPTIILNSAEAARDLMDRKGANYSDRPRQILHGELFGLGNTMPFMRYGERFRLQRRLMQQHFNSQAIPSFRPLQHEQVSIFLKNMLTSPERLVHHVHRMSTGSLLMVTYGHEVVSDDDYVTKIAVDALSRTSESGTAGATPVDFFPICNYVPSWFPGAGFQKGVAETRKLVDDMIGVPYNEVKKSRASGMAVSSLVTRMLDINETKHAGNADNEFDIKNIAGIIYGAGVETSEDVIMTFVLMMTCHPEIVERAQKEIDNFVGTDRLPTLDDRESLPYIDCILKEVFRINPPLPLGVPHQSLKEDVYRGSRIPAGSLIIPNIWLMMRDERYFPDPDKFDPERFLTKGEASQKEDKIPGEALRGLNGLNLGDPSSLVFGFGRRACPGRFFADANAWLTMANILAAFNIRAPVDPVTGVVLKPAIEFDQKGTSKPKPFKCEILPRSAKYVAMINQDPSNL
ncbi:cytochrome P450 [Phellopilus nigrolimitatus]|nr:cytochrome P450 [Phellopilus nigrolimitatus]